VTQTVTEHRVPATPRRPTQRATHWVLFGSLASGIGAFAFTTLGARILGEAAYQPIAVLWTIQYLAGTIVLFSAEAFVARALQNGEGVGLDRSVRVIGGWVAGFAALTGVVTYLLREPLFHGEGHLAAAAALLIASYAGFYVIKGRMAGTNRFRSYGAATALESLGRILIAVPVLALLPTTAALGWVMPLGPAMVVAWWIYDRGRALPPDPIAEDELAPVTAGAGSFLAATTTANAVSQTLLAAGPLVILPLGASPSEVSVFFVVVTAARVPLVFAIGGLLSRLLPPLTRLARAGDDAMLRRIALLTVPATVAVALVGALAAWFAGVPVVSAIFDITRPDRVFVVLTVFGVMLATGSLLLNQILIARGSEHRLVPPWLGALAVAALIVVLTPGTPTLRVSVAFAAGEVVALLGLLGAVLTAPALVRTPGEQVGVTAAPAPVAEP